MTQVPLKPGAVSPAFEQILPTLRERMNSLGLSLTAWDGSGHCVDEDQTHDSLCRHFLHHSCPCMDRLESLARRVLQTNSAIAEQRGACCFIAAPVFQRRRLLGAVVGGFLTKESIDDGTLEDLCRQGGVNVAESLETARHMSLHSRQEGEYLLRVLGWLLEREQIAVNSASELGTLSANLASTYEELSLLYRISGSMKVTQEPREFLQNICHDLVEVMHLSGAAAVVFPRPPAQDDEMVVLAGDLDVNAQQVRLLAATQAATEKIRVQPLVHNHFQPPSDGSLGTGMKKVIAAPMWADKDIVGLLVGFNKTPGDFDSADIKLIGSIANQSAVFLSNNRLYAELSDLLMGVLHALTATIDAKDPYTCGHSERVAILSRTIAEAMGLDPQHVQQIYLSGLLHDIGKIGVPESVLRKPGRLTDEEYKAIKTHPSIGAKILGGIHQLDGVIQAILHHHERPDGKGYPNGLAAGDVPKEALIVGLADVFDAMTSDRTYRQARPLATVIEEIRRWRGSQFDSEAVDVFLSLDLEKLLDDLRQGAKTVFPAEAAKEASL